MRSLPTFAISALLACGPVTPVDVGTTTTAPGTSDTTDAPSPTTTGPTATTTATLDATTTTTTTTTDSAFVSKPDNGLPGFQCDVFAQDCPPGQKCAPWAEDGSAWNDLKCVDITGNGAPGEPCTTTGGGVSGLDDCALGSICWNIDENNHGACIALCTGTIQEPMCALGFECVIAADAALVLCIPTCDPLLQDCSGDQLCVPSGDNFMCVFDASGDEGQTNDPCNFASSCDKGLVCINTATASSACDQDALGCCTPYCKYPDAPCPNPDQQCKQWFDPMMPIPPEYTDVGVCAIPQ